MTRSTVTPPHARPSRAIAWMALACACGLAQAQTSGGMSSDMNGGANGGTNGSASSDMQPYGPTGAGPVSYGDTGYYDANRQSWLPYTTSGYAGIGGGNGKLRNDCVAGTECNDPDWALKIYTGGMFSQWAGIELGYTHLDDAKRNGGTTKVQALSLVFSATAPLGPNFDIHGRLGGTYGWTKVEAPAIVPVATGSENGFGWTGGVGLGWNWDRNWGLSLDWDRYRLKFAGGDRENVDSAILSVRYRF